MSPTTKTARTGTTTMPADCPHCKDSFAATVDRTQPLRLQGAKCPHCKLFVPIRVLAEQVHDDAGS